MVLIILVFAPVSAYATTNGEEDLAGRLSITYRASGREVSADMRKTLAEYNIAVDRNSLVEIIQRGDDKGTQLCVTKTNGALVTKTTLMSVGDNGELNNFTAADVAAASQNPSGASVYTNPFNDSLQLVFGASYYAYTYGGISERIIQPQSVVFVYFDPDNRYTMSRVAFSYKCYGDEGYFDGTTFTTIFSGADGHYYSMSKTVTNPLPSNYYSISKPISSNKAIRVCSEMGYDPYMRYQWVTFTLTGKRNRDNKAIDIWDDLLLYPPAR